VKDIIKAAIGPILMIAIIAVIVWPILQCNRNPENLVYKKDERTGLCYAYAPSGYSGATEVPCSPRVLGLLEE
jgi:hypothetical protein